MTYTETTATIAKGGKITPKANTIAKIELHLTINRSFAKSLPPFSGGDDFNPFQRVGKR